MVSATLNPEHYQAKYTVIKDFRNEHGERFIVYKKNDSDILCLTGDEFNWEEGWKIHPFGVVIKGESFEFSDSELSELSPAIKDAYLNTCDQSLTTLISKEMTTYWSSISKLSVQGKE